MYVLICLCVTGSTAQERYKAGHPEKKKKTHYFIVFCVISDAQLHSHRSRLLARHVPFVPLLYFSRSLCFTYYENE